MELINCQQKNYTKALDFFIERGGKVIETEHGWCNFYKMPTGVFYLENLYVYPDSRNKQNGSSLLMRLETHLSEIEGACEYYTTISTNFGNKDKTLLICLKRGFKIHSMDADSIYLKKEL